MKLSVIIPAYNHLAAVLTCLNSLHDTAVTNVEYLVQDDCSPDYLGTAVISPLLASVERNAMNVGFSGNCNAGARRASGDILFFVNQDVEAVPQVSHGWDAAILAAFLDSSIGIVGARLVFRDGSIQSAGGLFDAKSQPFHRCLGYSDMNYHEVAAPREVSWVTGAALAIRRDLFAQIGGFDMAYVKGYFEDVDICMKARQAGFKVWYEPRATLVHPAGITGGNPHFTQNAQLFKQRWVDSGMIKPDVYAVKVGYW